MSLIEEVNEFLMSIGDKECTNDSTTDNAHTDAINALRDAGVKMNGEDIKALARSKQIYKESEIANLISAIKRKIN